VPLEFGILRIGAALKQQRETERHRSFLRFSWVSSPVCGPRPAAVAWAAYFGRLPMAGTDFAFMGHIATPIILILLTLAEIVYEKAPRSAGNKLFPLELVLPS
jgi:hypothetical protein